MYLEALNLLVNNRTQLIISAHNCHNVLQHWIFALERPANNHFKVLSQINLKVHSRLVTDSSICIESGFVLENCITR